MQPAGAAAEDQANGPATSSSTSAAVPATDGAQSTASTSSSTSQGTSSAAPSGSGPNPTGNNQAPPQPAPFGGASPHVVRQALTMAFSALRQMLNAGAGVDDGGPPAGAAQQGAPGNAQPAGAAPNVPQPENVVNPNGPAQPRAAVPPAAGGGPGAFFAANPFAGIQAPTGSGGMPRLPNPQHHHHHFHPLADPNLPRFRSDKEWITPVGQLTLMEWVERRETALHWRCDDKLCLSAPPEHAREVYAGEISQWQMSNEPLVPLISMDQAQLPSEADGPEAPVLLACTHRYHTSCLRSSCPSADRWHHDEENSKVTLRCPRCRAEVSYCGPPRTTELRLTWVCCITGLGG